MSVRRDDVFESLSWQDVKYSDRSVPEKNNIRTLGSKQVPKWYRSVANNIYSIMSLNDNWDSYGADSISYSVAKATDDLLINIMQQETPPPQVVPSANGGIQLEWHDFGIDFEILVTSMSHAFVTFEDIDGGETEWEGVVNYDLSKLVHYVNLITDRASDKQ